MNRNRGSQRVRFLFGQKSKLVDAVFDRFFGVAIAFLHLALDLIRLTFDFQALVTGQAARSFFELAFALLNNAFNLIFVHGGPFADM